MCEFVSWKEVDKDVFFLTNKDLKPRKLKEYKEYNSNWREDLCGHGAIDWFYPEIKGNGKHKECTDFSTPDNFPPLVVEAIKNMEMTNIGFSLGLLNDKGKAEYLKIEQPARTEYEKIQQPAWAEYLKIQQSDMWKLFRQKKYRNPKWI